MSSVTFTKVNFIHIESDNTYYDTRRQTEIKNSRIFVDSSVRAKLSGSNIAHNLISENVVARLKKQVDASAPSFLTGSTVKDSSNNDRKILSTNIDTTVTASIDAYKHGIEILQEKQWAAGLVKISAGTPGHLFDSMRYGLPKLDIIPSDEFVEIETFNPIKFVETGGDYKLFTYPIVTSDRNLAENLILDGVIEPFPIRPVISNFSLNVPFEPRATRGTFESGNQNKLFSSDQIVSFDYIQPPKGNRTAFLEASVPVMEVITTGTASLLVGSRIDYFNLDENYIDSFVDYVPPRGHTPSSTYSSDMLNLINKMPSRETTYLSEKQVSFSCGFTYDNNELGTDSIAYGGLLY